MKIVSMLKWFHNWVGFIVSLFMLIALVSGVYLGAVSVLKHLDDKGQVYQELTDKQQAYVIEQVFERYPHMSSVNLPTPYRPYIEAATRGQSVALDLELNELSTYSFKDSPVYSTMFWLHRQFLLGDVGKYTNAWASLLGAVVTLIGIYLWWRVRKGFRLSQTLPKDTRSSSLVKSHIQLGLFISIPLFVLCLSGFLITYKGLWVGNLKHDTSAMTYPVGEAQDWTSQLSLVKQMWPEAILVSVSKPRDADKKDEAEFVYSLRFDSNEDVWLRQTDTININHHTGEIVSALKHSDRNLAGQISAFVRPLHDGLNMPLSYVLFITLVSIFGSMILLFSSVTFYRKTFQKKPLKVHANRFAKEKSEQA